MDLDLLTLSRIQFALTVAFHYIYPPLSIGIGVILVAMESMYLVTNQKIYLQMTRFWVKIFALTFAIGVATGIVMEFEFGTNWAVYSRYVGDIFGSALAAEGIFAFFLESGFLAVLLFGWDKVGKKMHFFSTCMVSLGSMFSAVWIVVANSWQQTPTGFHIVGEGINARAEVTDFWAMVLNPSSIDRLTHVVLGSWQAGAWLVISVSAYYLIKGIHKEFARKSIKIALIFAVFAAVMQAVTGHSSAVYVSKYQPAKLAAFEGQYQTKANADLTLFGWVDEKNEKTYAVKIPGMLSFLIHGDVNKEVIGLNEFTPDLRPPVNITFQFYHLMIALGGWLLLMSLIGVIAWNRGFLFENKFLLTVMAFTVLAPQIANQVGWFAAEVGRQPWIVYNLLKTSDSLSEAVTAEMVLSSLIMFTLIYMLLFFLFVFLLNRKIKHGPEKMEEIESHMFTKGERA
jgi:cytochrome d ubiquinol oxidase subunit I